MTRSRIIVISIILVVLLLIGGGIFWVVRRNQPEKILQRAALALHIKDYPKALDTANQYIAKRPTDWEGYFIAAQSYMHMAKYDLARDPIKRALEHQPNNVRLHLLMAESYSLPAARLLATENPGRPPEEIRKQVEGIKKGNEQVIGVKIDVPATAGDEERKKAAAGNLDIQEYMGLNEIRIGQACRMLETRCNALAEQAEKSSLTEIVKVHRESAKAAANEAEQSTQSGMDRLIQVVNQDPRRSRASTSLIELAQQRNNKEIIDRVAAALKTIDNPPPTPAMMLIVHELRSQAKEANVSEMRPRFVEKAKELDRLIDKHKAERDRMSQAEQHTRDVEMQQVRLVRAELALLLGDLTMADSLAAQVLESDGRRAQARFIRAEVLMNRGEVVEAERVLNAIKTDFPRWPRAQFAYGKAALAVGKRQLALTAFRQALALDPTHAEARRLVAELSMSEGEYNQARADAEAAVKARPGDPGAIRLYAEALIRLKEFQVARDFLAGKEKEFASKPEVLLALIESYALMDDKEKAKELTKLLVDSSPNTAEGRIAVARAMMVSGRLAEAEKMLADEYARDPSNAGVAFELGRVMVLTRRPLQSLEFYRKALAGNPTNIQYRLALAQVLYESGELEEATTVLQPVEPGNAAANLLRMQIGLLQGKPLDARQMLQQIGEGKQSGLPLAVLYLRKGEAAECAKLCEAELKRRPGDVDAMTVLGQALVALGQQDKAAETFKAVLKADPNRLASYLQAAAVLSATKSPPEVGTEMKAIQGVQGDLVDLTVGWLFTRQKKIAEARVVYERLANDDKAPQPSRQKARLLLAESLANEGRLDDALKQVDLLAVDKTWQKPTMEAKVRLLVAAKRFKDAEKIVQELRKIAADEKDSLMLGRLVTAYVQMNQPNDALAVCDQMSLLQPKDSRPWLLKAEIFKSQNRVNDVVNAQNKAIELAPNDFETYVALAKTYDAFHKPVAALEVLDRLEKASQAGRLFAFMERGLMFARWGLRAQAIENFEKLQQQDLSANPNLQFEIAATLAQMGRKDAARALLAKIPEYSQLYLRTQMLLADIAPDTNAALAIIRQYGKRVPGDALVHEMLLLTRDKRFQEAANAFKAFQAANANVPDQAAAMAVQALVQTGATGEAAALCQAMAAKPNAQPSWRQLGALMLMETKPDEAGKLLPAPAVATVFDALVGIALAAQKGEVETGRTWQSLLVQIEAELAKMNPPTLLAPRLKVLASIASGVTGQATTELNNARNLSPMEVSVLRELVSQATSNPKAITEAGLLLKASLATEWSLGALARGWGLQALKARPTCQFAADQIVRSGADLETRRQVLAALQPTNCLLALMIQAGVLTEEKNYEKAVEVLTAAAKAAADHPGMIMEVATATERAGRLKDAADLYRSIYTQHRHPIAANNGAYLIAILWNNDLERLAEAQKWMEETVKENPNVPAFRDTLGWIAFRRGEKETALTNLWLGVKGSPGSAENHFHLGMAEIDAGNKQLGRWHLAAAIEIGKQMKDDGKDIPPSTQDAIKTAAAELEKTAGLDAEKK